tara:strand:+ start:1291 stop:1725 length:435 start_codon:yes stop_codon:yes gene_type:complete
MRYAILVILLLTLTACGTTTSEDLRQVADAIETVEDKVDSVKNTVDQVKNDINNVKNKVTNEDVATVELHGLLFNPEELTIARGTTVQWIQMDEGNHTVTDDNNKFDSGHMRKGASFEQTFTVPGEITYHCDIHENMFGKIIVT